MGLKIEASIHRVTDGSWASILVPTGLLSQTPGAKTPCWWRLDPPRVCSDPCGSERTPDGTRTLHSGTINDECVYGFRGLSDLRAISTDPLRKNWGLG